MPHDRIAARATSPTVVEIRSLVSWGRAAGHEGQPVPAGAVSVPSGRLRGSGHLFRGLDAVRRARRTGADVRLVPLVHGRGARRDARRVRWDRGHGARADVVRHDAEPQPAGGGVGERNTHRTARDGVDRPGSLARQDPRAAPDRRGVRDARLLERGPARGRAAGRSELRRQPQQRDTDGGDA